MDGLSTPARTERDPGSLCRRAEPGPGSGTWRQSAHRPQGPRKGERSRSSPRALAPSPGALVAAPLDGTPDQNLELDEAPLDEASSSIGLQNKRSLPAQQDVPSERWKPLGLEPPEVFALLRCHLRRHVVEHDDIEASRLKILFDDFRRGRESYLREPWQKAMANTVHPPVLRQRRKWRTACRASRRETPQQRPLACRRRS